MTAHAAIRAVMPMWASCAKVNPVLSATSIVPVTTDLLTECLAFDDVAASGDLERRSELLEAAEDGRMRVATLDDCAVGFSVMAPWFFGVPFLALAYVDAAVRGRGTGTRLLEDVELSHSTRVFTSTNMSNAPMQRLLTIRGWTPCGMLDGLDEGDPEIFFVRNP